MATKKKTAGSGARYTGGGSLNAAGRAAVHAAATGPAAVSSAADLAELAGAASQYGLNKTVAPAGGAAAYSAYLQSQQPTYSGGGGGGGSYNPLTDPTYAAYIANLDVEQAQRQQDVAQRRAYLQADQDLLLADTAREGDLQRQNIAGNYEDRGLFLSGARQGDQARSQANQLAREGRIRSDTARGIGDLESALAQYLAQQQLRRQQAALGIFS